MEGSDAAVASLLGKVISLLWSDVFILTEACCVCGRPAIGRVQSDVHLAEAMERKWKTKCGPKQYLCGKRLSEILPRSGVDLVVGDKLCNTHWSSLSRQVPVLFGVGLSLPVVSLRSRSTAKVARRRDSGRRVGCGYPGFFVPIFPLPTLSQVLSADGKAK